MFCAWKPIVCRLYADMEGQVIKSSSPCTCGKRARTDNALLKPMEGTCHCQTVRSRQMGVLYGKKEDCSGKEFVAHPLDKEPELIVAAVHAAIRQQADQVQCVLLGRWLQVFPAIQVEKFTGLQRLVHQRRPLAHLSKSMVGSFFECSIACIMVCMVRWQVVGDAEQWHAGSETLCW